MKWSQSFLNTYREAPKDAEIVSHRLLSRGHFIKKHAAGIYSFLPLFVKSLHKLNQIIRTELEKIQWQEVIMPFVIPSELWKESQRWQLYGKELLRLKDRKDNDFCLGPTHEEVVTDLVRNQVTSFRQLPQSLFQITNKFRDELRPRFGLMRSREFLMMDGYSFHANSEDLDRHYEVVADAYDKIFQKAGLKFVRVEADTGAIGGTGSHEFHVLAESGEDCIVSCVNCDYGANLEKAQKAFFEEPLKNSDPFEKLNFLEKVSTPHQKTIADLSEFFSLDKKYFLKTLFYKFLLHSHSQTLETQNKKNEQFLAVYLLGHREVNEVKLRAWIEKHLGPVLNLSLADQHEAALKFFSCPSGFWGPHLKTKNSSSPSQQSATENLGIHQLFDREIFEHSQIICGANEEFYHYKNVSPQRDFLEYSTPKFSEKVIDLSQVVEGDLCPKCQNTRDQNKPQQQQKGFLKWTRGIEVGHIFKLGKKYSQSMEATFQNENKENNFFEMGCYGIGVSRVLSACLEQNHDENGIVWPVSLAPYQVILINLGKEKEVLEWSDKIYHILKEKNVEVLWDDRDQSPGVKFKDADLIGIPHRLVLGMKSIQQMSVEYSFRATPKTKENILFNDLENFINNQVLTSVNKSKSTLIS